MVTVQPIYQINLILQFVILTVLIVGFFTVKKRRFDKHGHIMTFAVILQGILIVFIMDISLIRNFGVLATTPAVGAGITITHAAIGGFAWILGLILVFKKFGNVKMWMRTVFIAWILALSLGVGFYLFYYIRV